MLHLRRSIGHWLRAWGCRVKLVLPWPDKKLNPNARLHWRAKHAVKAPSREAARLIGIEAMQAHGIKASDFASDGKLDLIVCFYPPDRRHRDDDNMVGSFKTLRDGLADAFGVNDRRFRAHYFFHDPDAPGRIEVEVETKARSEFLFYSHRTVAEVDVEESGGVDIFRHNGARSAVDGLPTSKGRSA